MEGYMVMEMKVTCRKATPKDLEQIWNMNIADHPGDDNWPMWKKQYLSYNQNGTAVTFVILCDGTPVGEGTLLFSPECDAVSRRTQLADRKTTANINALRIRKEYEGKGYISALVHRMELYAAENGYERLTIGVEAREVRTLAIYLHWGYDELVTTEIWHDQPVLYYAKNLKL